MSNSDATENAHYINFEEVNTKQLKLQEIDYLYEAALALAKKTGDRELFLERKVAFGRNIKQLEEQYSAYVHFTNLVLDARDKLVNENPSIESYLHLTVLEEYPGMFLPSLLFSMNTKRSVIRAKALREELIKQWHMQLLIARQTATDNSEKNDEVIDDIFQQTNFQDLAEVITIIMQSGIESETKVKLIALYQQEEEIFTAISELMLSLSNIIREHIHLVQSDLDRVLSQKSYVNRIRKMLVSYIKMELPESIEVKIIPVLMQPNVMLIYYAQENLMRIYTGIFAAEMDAINDSVEQEIKLISEGAKLLADSTRLKALLLLQKRPMYLKELADTLGLSSATMSHHMTSLMSEHLVQGEVASDSRRVYYSLSKPRLIELGHAISALGDSVESEA